MDHPPQNPNPQVTPSNQTVPPQSPPPASRSHAKMLTVLGIVFGLLLLVAGGYFLWQNSQHTSPITSSPTASPSSPFSPNTKDGGIPITAKTVSFTRVNNEVFLRYKGKIYSQEAANKNDPSLTNLPNPEAYTWYGLIDAPDFASDLSGFDELFDFKVFPNKQNFIFIMRWPSPSQINNFTVFYYDISKTSDKVSPLLSFVADQQNTNNVPRINQISKDGRYVAFDMYSCWNCGGHRPDVMLYDMQTKTSKRIGITSYFSWKENGNYEYKVYKPIPCATPAEGPGECSEDPTKLPLLTGKI